MLPVHCGPERAPLCLISLQVLGTRDSALWIHFHCEAEGKTDNVVKPVISTHISLVKTCHVTTPNSKGKEVQFYHMPRRGRNRAFGEQH